MAHISCTLANLPGTNARRQTGVSRAQRPLAKRIRHGSSTFGPRPDGQCTFITFVTFVPLARTHRIESMMLESLLLSQDTELVRVVRPTLEKLSIDVEICYEARKATDILISEKFDAVIVDCDDLTGGLAVLQGLRGTPSNKNSVTFAVLNGKKTTTQEAFGMGANFVLQKPLSTLNASRCFHAALNFMVRERRRYFRHPVKMQVNIVLGDKVVKATSTNVSESGIALILREALPKGATPRVQFGLPETNLKFDIDAEVVWSDLKGRAGLRFQNLAKESLGQLEKWLDERLEEEMPGAREKIAAAEQPQR
jgi:CheY-like chemotaxis protein